MRLSLSRGSLTLVFVAAAPLMASGQQDADQNTALPDYPNRYTTHVDVITLPDGRAMGSGNAIDVDSEGNVWVFERCGGNNNACLQSDVDPVLKYTPEGEFLFSFGAGLFVWPHGIVVDDDDNLWLIDAGVVDGRSLSTPVRR